MFVCASPNGYKICAIYMYKLFWERIDDTPFFILDIQYEAYDTYELQSALPNFGYIVTQLSSELSNINN